MQTSLVLLGACLVSPLVGGSAPAFRAAARTDHSPAAPAADTVRIHAIRVSDDDGGRRCAIEPRQVERWVAYANTLFRPADIAFEFDPAADWSELRSTLLNNIAESGDATWREASRDGNRAAAEHAGKLVVLFRHGPGFLPSGGGFSSFTYNFVVAPRFDATIVCGRQNKHLLAHEIGHYLGLPHTFAREFATLKQAEEFLAQNGGKLSAFDGDGLSDTPPDPFVREVQCGDHALITLAGKRVPIARNNLMSYYHGDAQTALSPQQLARVRWALNVRREHAMATPTNVRLAAPDRVTTTWAASDAPGAATEPDGVTRIEAELSTIGAASRASAQVQEMDGFGVGNWSGGRQQFCRFEADGVLTFRFRPGFADKRRIIIYATQAPDYGRFRLSVVGLAPKKVVDAYAPLVLATGPIDLGIVTLETREYELKIECLGKNAHATGTQFGLDCLSLEPVRSPTPREP